MCHLTRNSLICNKCGQEIESTHRHDFKWCNCGNIFVDGGYEAYAPRFGGAALEDNSYTLTTAYGLCEDPDCWRRNLIREEEYAKTFGGNG